MRRRSSVLLATSAALLLIGGTAPVHAANSDDPLGLERTLASPPSVHRPNVYWWWPGTDVSGDELDDEIGAIKDAGFGAAQIVDLEGGAAQGGVGWQWGTPQWFEHVNHAVERGISTGLRIDGAPYPVWPMSSPAVTGSNTDLSAQELVYAQQDVTGPMEFVGPPPDAPGVVGGKKLVAVTAAQPVDAGSAGAAAPAQAPVMLDPKTAVDLTDQVDGNGLVHWSVPAGHWTLFGFWRRPTGQTPQAISSFFGRTVVEDQTPPGAYPNDLLVVDPFSREATQLALDWLSKHMMTSEAARLWRQDGGELYEDSLEYSTGAGSDLFWTVRFLEEFKDRRGYSLQPFLPVLFIRGQHNYVLSLFGTASEQPDFDFPDGLGARVRHDYYQTLTDLFIEHQRLLAQWAQKYGLTFRHQSYGITIDSSRAQGVGGIVDTETLLAGDPQPAGSAMADGALDVYRVAAGAAHIYGSPSVYLETGDIVDVSAPGAQSKQFVPYGEEPSDYWQIINHAYMGGATKVQLHGFAFRFIPPPPASNTVFGPQLHPWPGWTPWGEVAISEPWNKTWPQWKFWSQYATYLARASQILSAGKPRIDLLVYRDGFVTGPGPYFEGKALAKTGFTYEYTDPETLVAKGSVRERRLFPDGPAYKALIIDQSVNRIPGLPGTSAEKLAELARDGLPVVFVGPLPDRGTSAADTPGEDAQVGGAVAGMMSLPNVRHVGDIDELGDALAALGVSPDSAWDRSLLVRPVHRYTPTRDYWYFWNEDSHPVTFSASLATSGAPYEVDLWNNRVSPVAQYEQKGATLEMPVHLGPQQAIVVVVDRSQAAPLHVVSTTASRATATSAGPSIEDTEPGTYDAALSDGTTTTVTMGPTPDPILPTKWDLHVEEFTPSGSPTHELNPTSLKDWREISELQYASGTATYTTSVAVPDSWRTPGRGVYLSLGKLYGASQVSVNGQPVTRAVVILPDDRWPVGDLLHAGTNTITVRLATTPLNQLIGLGKSGDPRYAAFATKATAPAGLAGPVTLTSYNTTALTSDNTTAPTRRSCASRRTIEFTLPARARTHAVVVFVNRDRVSAKRVGKRLRVSLSGRPSGTYTVSVKERHGGRWRVLATHRYHTCTPRLTARLTLRHAVAIVSGRAPSGATVRVKLQRGRKVVALRNVTAEGGTFRVILRARHPGKYRALVTARKGQVTLKMPTQIRTKPAARKN